VSQLAWTPEYERRLQVLRERFASDPDNTDLSELRPVVARSWMRSLRCQVDPDMHNFPVVDDVHLDEQFMRTAAPVLDHLGQVAQDTGASIWLADAGGTITAVHGDKTELRACERRLSTVGGVMAEDIVGTNGEGTAIEEGGAVQIWAGEHFASAMQHFCCTSVPVQDPLRRSLRAVLTVAIPARIAQGVDPRLPALIAHGAAAELQQLLTARLALREQALLSAYLAESRKRGSDAVVVMDDRTTIASRGALSVLTDGDHGVLAGYASEAARTGRSLDRAITLETGEHAVVTVRPVPSDGDHRASLIRLRRDSQPPALVTHSARPSDRPGGFDALVGRSSALYRTLEVAATATRRRQAVYIVGESGTGKYELAATIAAQRADVVVTFECTPEQSMLEGGVPAVRGALARGAAVVIRQADRLPVGTRIALADMFDEVDCSAVVLTYAKPVRLDDTRLVDSLAAVEIEMPPLRLRRDDIPLLVKHFLAQAAYGALECSPPLMKAITQAEWAGNVRQLKNFVDTAAARCPSVKLDVPHLSDGQRRLLATVPLSRLEEAELRQIRDALADAKGNRVRAAELLEIGRSTLYRKIATYERRGYELHT
jgi:sigma-54 dependent transcriptional regulator, acetoin dehydrogenase operon transcriptional activator AcoR